MNLALWRLAKGDRDANIVGQALGRSATRGVGTEESSRASGRGVTCAFAGRAGAGSREGKVHVVGELVVTESGPSEEGVIGGVLVTRTLRVRQRELDDAAVDARALAVGAGEVRNPSNSTVERTGDCGTALGCAITSEQEDGRGAASTVVNEIDTVSLRLALDGAGAGGNNGGGESEENLGEHLVGDGDGVLSLE